MWDAHARQSTVHECSALNTMYRIASTATAGQGLQPADWMPAGQTARHVPSTVCICNCDINGPLQTSVHASRHRTVLHSEACSRSALRDVPCGI